MSLIKIEKYSTHSCIGIHHVYVKTPQISKREEFCKWVTQSNCCSCICCSLPQSQQYSRHITIHTMHCYAAHYHSHNSTAPYYCTYCALLRCSLPQSQQYSPILLYILCIVLIPILPPLNPHFMHHLSHTKSRCLYTLMRFGAHRRLLQGVPPQLLLQCIHPTTNTGSLKDKCSHVRIAHVPGIVKTDSKTAFEYFQCFIF
jgi:hypothetical protein